MNLQFSVLLFCSRCSASLHTMKSLSLWSLCADYPNKASCPEWKDFSSTEGNIEQNRVLIIVSTWDFCKLQTVFQAMQLTLRRRNRKCNISNFPPGEVHLQASIANRLTVSVWSHCLLRTDQQMMASHFSNPIAADITVWILSCVFAVSSSWTAWIFVPDQTTIVGL